MAPRTASGDQVSVMVPWEPERHLRAVDPALVRYSRGFLRSHPERWFPGLDAHWLPLSSVLGAELRVTQVRPMMGAPDDVAAEYFGTVDEEPLRVTLNADSVRVLLGSVGPSLRDEGRRVVLEYLMRRFLSTLATCWSGPESSVVRFDSEMASGAAGWAGRVQIELMVNTSPCQLTVVCGRTLLDRLDGLWRRQIHSTSKGMEEPQRAMIELAQLAVPPATLVDYVRPGTAVDLEVPWGDLVTVRLGSKPWISARMCNVSGKFALETIAPQQHAPGVPEGTTRLSIVFGALDLDPALIAELSQPGAMLDTGIALSNRAELVINGERVAQAAVCLYEGRFAVNVE